MIDRHMQKPCTYAFPLGQSPQTLSPAPPSNFLHPEQGHERALYGLVGRMQMSPHRGTICHETKPVLEPIALHRLAAIGRERVPHAIDLCLIGAIDWRATSLR